MIAQHIFKITIVAFSLANSFIASAQQQNFSYSHSAFLVIGQPDFNADSVNQAGPVTARTLNTPAQTLILNGKFLVADALNNRVLIYNSVFNVSNTAADVVIGQYDFTGNAENHGGKTSADALDRPSGLATDGQKLFVLDRDNHRVLIYDSLPVSNGASADVVIGHSTMTDGSWGGESALNDTIGLSANKLSSGPTGLVYDSINGKLIVYDSDNDRVLIYNHIPDSNGVAADVVIGQPDFTHNQTNQGGIVGANTLDLSTASGVAIYNGKLLIADRQNNRVLVYNKIPSTNNAMADVVIGQADFTGNKPNMGNAISASGMNLPRAIAFDKFGRLYIGEAGNERILVYNQIPVSNGVVADYVIGQKDFKTGGDRPASDSTFYFIYHLLINNETLIVSDAASNRVLFFKIYNLPEITENNTIKSSDIVLYPNPNQGTFYLVFKKIPVSPFQILIVDMLGRVVYKQINEANDGKIKLILSNLKAGRYNMVIKGANVNATKFMVVIK